MSRQVKKVNISGKEDKSNKVSSWSNTTTDIHYPSEKLVKDSLDGKANSTHTHSQYLTEHQDLSNYVTTDDSRLSDARTPTSHTHTKSQITDFPTMPSASSTVPSADTTNGSYGSGTSYARSNHTHPKSSLYAEASHTHSQYLTSHQDISSKEDTSNKLTSLQSLDDLSTDTQYPSAKLVYTYWSDLNDTLQNDYPLSNSLGAVAFSNDYTDLDNLPQLGNLAFEDTIDLTGHDINELDDGSGLLFSGDYNDLDNKPTIPTGTSDLINNSGFLTHQDISGKIDSAGTGLSKSGTTLNHSNSITALTTASFKKVKYDSQGHITGTSDVSASDLPTHTHSQYLTSHQDITGKEDSSNKVSSWNSTTNNTRYPTEKLVKDSLDGKQATLVSGTNIRTINNTPILGSGNIVIPTPPTIVTAWESTPSDSKVASEKLTKDSLDGKADNNHTHEVLLSSNDDSDIQLFNVSAQGIPQGEGQSLGAFLSEFWKKIYPIGSIYMNTNNVDPAILFGGQWEQIENRFLLASGSTYGNGTTGGSADAVLVSHNHATSTSGETFVTSESSEANNTRVTYSSSGNRYVDGMTASTTPFHHRVGTGYSGVSGTGKNMPPYLAVNVWKRIA